MAFYILKKEEGITSNDLVIKLKKKLNVKSVGHSGTLDPFATGVIILATEGEKKLLSRFLESKKTYSGKIYFGKTTDTLDPTGKITEEKKVDDVDKNELIKFINEKFLGKVKQTPPIFSAQKIGGKKAYEYARKNEEVDLKEKDKIIYSFEIEKIDNNTFSFLIEVSSGTYIRKIAYDLGQMINVPSMLLELKREKIGSISLKDAQEIGDDLKEYTASELLNLKIFLVSNETMKRAHEGKEIYLSQNSKEAIVQFEDIQILMKRVNKNLFKISKRLK